MENSDNPRRLDSKAYRLFRSECASHLRDLEGILDPRPETISKEQSEMGRIKCHTIKGGAGFFGLEELAKCCAKMEKLFTDWSTGNNAVQLKSEQLARDGFAELRRLVGKLPEPPTKPEE